MSDPPPVLLATNLTKRYPGVLALHNVGLTLHRGEILAVIGENGAGKSTLMKILAGIERADAGAIQLDGRPTAIESVRDASAHGIALIHQELNLTDNLDISGNVFLGREPRRLGRVGLIDRKRLYADTRVALKKVLLDCDPSTPVALLSPGRRQLVELARVLSMNARVLIMDEPTSSLSKRETDQLFDVMRDLRSCGVSIIYISHRLGEVSAVADRVAVLRDGCNAGELSHAQIDHDAMIRLMVGRDLEQYYHEPTHAAGDLMLQVSALRVPGTDEPVSLSVRCGEIVGLAGLVGAGRSELLRCLFGVDRAISGRVAIAGRVVRLSSPLDAIRAGVALVPEDRKKQGLVLEMAVRHNVSLASLRDYQCAGFVRQSDERALVQRMTERLDVRTPTLTQPVQHLSGGNQQKVVLARWLALSPTVLLLDEPTRGVDVGAKQGIYTLMRELAQQGAAILFASSEMEEMLHMADRTLVMHQGRIAGELTREQITEQQVMRFATGSAA